MASRRLKGLSRDTFRSTGAMGLGWGDWMEGELIEANVGSFWTGERKAETIVNSGWLVLLLPLGIDIWEGGWMVFLKFRFDKGFDCVRVGRGSDGLGLGLETLAMSFGKVGARAPWASLCLVEMPLPEGTTVEGIASLACGFVEILVNLMGGALAMDASLLLGVTVGWTLGGTVLAKAVSGEEGSENRDVRECSRVPSVFGQEWSAILSCGVESD